MSGHDVVTVRLAKLEGEDRQQGMRANDARVVVGSTPGENQSDSAPDFMKENRAASP